MTDKPTYPPVIPTEFGGPVNEPWRFQGGINIRLNPEKKAEMIEKFGLDRVRRDFPEGFEDLDWLTGVDKKIAEFNEEVAKALKDAEDE